MNLFTLPTWLKPHLYTNQNYKDLSKTDIFNLKTKLERFSEELPEVSVVIPAWNEENNIYRMLSSLASTTTNLKVEILVVNNNSTDKTQMVLDELGIKSVFQPIQGTSPARELGLATAKGKYHLCADSDTFYPPDWIDLMVRPMRESNYVGVYGRYSFIPPAKNSRFPFAIYESITSILIKVRKKNKEHINVLGFNMGFITDIGKECGGFAVTQARVFDNALGSAYFVEESEDGRMALNLKTVGKLKLVENPKARVFTSSRRLIAEGGIFNAFFYRFKKHTKNMNEYIGKANQVK